MAGRADDVGDEEVELGEVEVETEGDLRNPGVFVWLLTLSAGISGLLFGCWLFSFPVYLISSHPVPSHSSHPSHQKLTLSRPPFR